MDGARDFCGKERLGNLEPFSLRRRVSVDREVHATAGQEAGATYSSVCWAHKRDLESGVVLGAGVDGDGGGFVVSGLAVMMLGTKVCGLRS